MLETKSVYVVPSLSMAFNPDKWNRPEIVGEANCMSYALDRQDLGWIFPGLDPLNSSPVFQKNDNLTRVWKSVRDLSGSQKAAEMLMKYAGLSRVHKHSVDPSKQHVIAFTGGHFYRLDGDGTWSHKNGGDLATNRDVKGNVILDVETLRSRKRLYCQEDYRETHELLSLIRGKEVMDPRYENFVPEYKALFNQLRRNAGKQLVESISFFTLPNDGFWVLPRDNKHMSAVPKMPIAA